MGTLSRWELALERKQDALLDKMFRKEPVELLDALRRECDDHAVVCSESRVVVPNAYEIELADSVHRELASREEELGQVLIDTLARHGDEKGYEWAGPLTVHITDTASAHLPNGRYRVSSTPAPHVRADSFPAH
jgi:hypothetical protein